MHPLGDEASLRKRLFAFEAFQEDQDRCALEVLGDDMLLQKGV